MRIYLARHRSTGLTLIEVMIVVVVLVLLGLVVVSRMTHVPRPANRLRCANNLKQIGLGFRLWSGDGVRFPQALSTNEGGTLEFGPEVWRHFLAISNELATPIVLWCPADRARRPAKDFGSLQNPSLSYFLSLDARETEPQMVLSGDRNLALAGKSPGPGVVSLATNSVVGWTQEIHPDGGNICLADGSVQLVTEARLQDQLRQGGSTNRIAIP